MNDFLLNVVVWLALISAMFHEFQPAMITELLLWIALSKVMYDRYDNAKKN